ncbi:MAG: restriction endonuclease subunit S [Mycobacterium sp.]
MKVARLGEVAELVSGGTPSRTNADYFGEGTPWVSITDLNDSYVKQTKESLTPAGLTNSAAKVIPDGTVLVAMYGASIGKLGIAGRSLSTNQAIAAVQPDHKRLNRQYLFHYLLSQREQLRSRGRGGAQPNISLGDLKNWPIPLPDLAEQRRIADILDHAEGLRTKRRSVLRRLASSIQSIFCDMFQDAISADGTPLSDLVEEFRYGTSVKSTRAGQPVLRIPNVLGGSLDLRDLKFVELGEAESKRLQLKDGDLLFVRTNGNRENVGRCAVFTAEPFEKAGLSKEGVVYASYLIRARLHGNLLSRFAATYLNGLGRRQLTKNSTTSAGQYNINIEGLRAVRVPHPSLDDQRAFLNRTTLIDVHMKQSVAQLDQLDSLVASLQSRAFSGNL